MKIVEIKELEPLKEFLKIVAKGMSNLVVTGRAGLGKSVYTTYWLDILLKKEDWNYKAGFSTPLSFYRWAYFNRTKKVLVLDDVEGLLSSDKGLGLLKCCLESVNENRTVYYDTTSEKIGDVPSEFILNARIVILANRIQKNRRVDIDAVLNRAFNYLVDLTYKQIIDIGKEILENRNDLTKEQKKKANEILERFVTPANLDFNLRCIEKLCILVKHNSHKAEELFAIDNPKNEIYEIYVEVQDMNISQMEKVKKFLAMADERGIQTSQRSYYRIKKVIEDGTNNGIL